VLATNSNQYNYNAGEQLLDLDTTALMSLPMNSLYSLTWGDYGTSLVSAIQLLRCHGDLVDCTLAAGGRSFPAHKIVLCAASPFLLDLLKVSTRRELFLFSSSSLPHNMYITSTTAFDFMACVLPLRTVCKQRNQRRQIG